MRFVDTNVLLYSVSTAAAEQEKAQIALKILDDPDLALSVQVLQEFYVQATRESKSDRITHEQAAALVPVSIHNQGCRRQFPRGR